MQGIKAFQADNENGFSMLELVIVSAISLFGAIIVFLMLGTIKERSVQTLDSQEALLTAVTAMKQITQEIRENAVLITYPQWDGKRADSRIDFEAEQSYNGQDYTLSYALDSNKVIRTYTNASGVSEQAVIAESVSDLVFEIDNPGNRYPENRYVKVELTLSIRGKEFTVRDSITLRN